jgi:molybdopterin synthase catalytic subunit
MAIVLHHPFDPAQLLGEFHAGQANFGGLASFTGFVRSENGDVLSLTLEHYNGFTEAVLDQIEQDAIARFQLLSCLLVHRAGIMLAGEPIVLVAALAPHRKPALLAIDYLMDRLKTEAPFWKKETGPTRSTWIEPRAEDYDARKQWDLNK